MSFSIEKIAELMAFHESAKTDSFIDFLKKVSALFPTPPPPPPPTWRGVVGGSGSPLQLTNSVESDDSRSVHSDDGGGIVIRQRKVKDAELHHLMTCIPFVKNSATMIMFRNLYLTSPEAFSRIGDSHYSGLDLYPHISVRVDVPIIHTHTGKHMKPLETVLHIYHQGEGSKKIFTDVTTAFDGEVRLIATFAVRT
jgi:hypothetical protein